MRVRIVYISLSVPLLLWRGGSCRAARTRSDDAISPSSYLGRTKWVKSSVAHINSLVGLSHFNAALPFAFRVKASGAAVVLSMFCLLLFLGSGGCLQQETDAF